MGYLHIENLYKDQTILLFRECFALEKIHGSSADLKWKCEEGRLFYFSGGQDRNRFFGLFNGAALHQLFATKFPAHDVTVHGEVYGGKLHGMSETYGKDLKFIAFDVLVGDTWLGVENAAALCESLCLEFVDFKRVPTTTESLNHERDKPSTQAIRNGCGEGKTREGVVLRPVVEFRTNRTANGGRIIAKHKCDAFRETKTPRVVSPEELKVLADARAIAEEWVTEMRLTHVLDKIPGAGIAQMREVLKAMTEDIVREGAGEFVDSKSARSYIGSKTAEMFKRRLSVTE